MTNMFAIVEVPALGITLDLIIPTHLTVTQVISLLTKIVYNTTHVMLDERKLLLCDVDARRILCGAGNLSKSSIKDACRLAIV